MNPSLEQLQSSIEAELHRTVDRLRAEYRAHGAERIVDELSAALFPPGKRMRPLLCCMGHLACGGGVSGGIISAAAALELLHTFAILHDDIMDAAETRRRQPSLHGRISSRRRTFPGPREAGHYGLSIAMLAGDLALVESDRLFVEAGLGAEALASAWKPLNRMRLDAVAGQYLDLSLNGRRVGPQQAGKIARLKSGSYSVQGPLAVGAALAGAGTAAMSALESFGGSTGEAFQLLDDLSGMFGGPGAGNDIESDLVQAKPTLLIAMALRDAGVQERQAILEALGNPAASSDARAAAREAILKSGAPQKTGHRIRLLVAEARLALQDPASKDLDGGVCDLLAAQAEDIATRAQKILGRPDAQTRA